ncbi:phosphoenolpyruvate hydrolase family protein [Phytoactinopolyspora alkaliphila]|uniref:Phosphoenolpyruvate hydrolase family protein n=1 Tax=Phytoactinopolyspora alkaliphila TaxID=1783498 RepID=A0A6N9YJM6_9ACTN|nr:phosphoenolpyruvate hydrolase family protein [Phytoactinopolyspora alkaliphila]NED95216.1 phosphoenolpyruvate hydrolase family protein [Phytoactinopolyspora alkaliphila]
MTRQEHLSRYRGKVEEGRPLIGAGAGTGISAKCAAAAGVDFIVIYNAGRFRMAGRGSMAGMMPFGNANDIVVEMAMEVLPVATPTPVLAGVCATDPTKNISMLLETLKSMGFAGVQNFPSVCLLDGSVREDLEATGYGFDKEVAMVARARELDLLTATYVRTDDEARAMAGAGADVIVAHVGLTAAGMIGGRNAVGLDEAAEKTQRVHDVVRSVNDEAFVVCHGGPIVSPGDAEYVLKRCDGVTGFLGASSMERIPVEIAITETIRAFTEIKLAPVIDPLNETRQEATL